MKNQINIKLNNLNLYEYLVNFNLIILLYLYIFQPPLINKLFYIGLEFILFMFIFLLKAKKIIKIFSIFKIEFFILIVIIIYTLCRDIITGEIVYSDRFIGWMFQSFIFGSIILIYYENRKNLLELIYWTSFMAALFSVILLVSPDFDNLYKSFSLDSVYETYKNFEVRYRGYGISENLTFTYSIIMGMFCGYSIILLRKNYLYFFPLVIFILATVLNARIGLVSIFIILMYLILIKVDFRILSRFVLLLIASTICLILYLKYMDINLNQVKFSANIDWVMEFFLDILGKTENSTLLILFDKFIIVPDKSLIEFLFGTGVSLFGLESKSSDVGYVLQLYYGGIIFLLLILIFMYYCFFRILKILGIKHWYSSFFILIILISNIKGFIFAATPGGRLLFFLYMYFIVKKYKERQLMKIEN